MAAAAQHVWSAIFYQDEWPIGLRERADRLQPVLFKYGTIAMTIASLDQQELAELRGLLLEFLDCAEDVAV